MTRARALKEVIRARAAKTGERYTTARRHVLNDLNPQMTGLPPRPAPAAPAARKNAPPPNVSKGGVSDAKSLEKTGHGLEHWFEVLDRFGGVAKGHTALARHLYDQHGVPGWHSQGITVAYERFRGARALNQRCDGVYEVSVSKVVAATSPKVIAALSEPRLRRRWMRGVDAELMKALSSALDAPASKGIVVRPDGLGRFRFRWGTTTVQLYLTPKPGGKMSVVATHGNLADAAAVDERRAQWRLALNALAQLFTGERITRSA